MTHKKAAKMSVERRKVRRNRYVAAIDPLRKRYGCSAAEVSTFVAQTEASLEKKIADLENQVTDLKTQLATPVQTV